MSSPPRHIDGPRLPPARGSATHLIVFCHGYGADGNDLIGLAPHWQRLLPTVAFASPHAPERCAVAGAGFQWFALNRMDAEEARRGTESAGPVLEAFLDTELARLGLSGARLALVGFSQGTMMALHVGLGRTVTPAAIVGYSGLLASTENLPARASPRPPVFLAHGTADQVIPDAAMFQAAAALGHAGLPVQWHLAHGVGHGIDEKGLALGGQFLANAFAGRLEPASSPIACAVAR